MLHIQKGLPAPSVHPSPQKTARFSRYLPSAKIHASPSKLPIDSFKRKPAKPTTNRHNDIGNEVVHTALIGQMRNAITSNFHAHHMENIDAPLSGNVEREMQAFADVFPSSGIDNASYETQYALAIQCIQSRFKHGGFTYGFDQDTEGVRDYWATPAETLADGGQNIDCEDFAFMAKKYGEALQQEIGFEGEFQVHGGLINGDHEQGHAICVFHASDGNQYVIDGTHFESGRGDPSQITTLAEYTENRDFVWNTDFSGNLKKLATSGEGDGKRYFLFGDRTPNLDGHDKPTDVIQAERDYLGTKHAMEAKTDIESESNAFRSLTGFFSDKRESLGNISILELGAVILGPITILVNALNFRKESKKVERIHDFQKAQEKYELAPQEADETYHRDQRNIAGVKGVLDMIRYVAFLVVVGGTGAVAAPIVALGASIVRFTAGTIETIANTQKSRRHYKLQKLQKPEIDKTIDGCPSEAKHILKSRMDYKMRKNWLHGSKIFATRKVSSYMGAAGLSTAALVSMAAAGSIVAANPILFGPALAVFGLLALVRLGESVHKGHLLRNQKEALLPEGQTLISERIKKIADSKSGKLARVGAALNVFGWITDFIDDKTRKSPRFLKRTVKLLAAPLYLIDLMFEKKTFTEEDIFNSMKEQFERTDISVKERKALLLTVSHFYKMPMVEVLTKWMSPHQVRELGQSATSVRKPRSQVVQAFLLHWKKQRRLLEESPTFTKKDFEWIQEWKQKLIDLTKPKFGGTTSF